MKRMNKWMVAAIVMIAFTTATHAQTLETAPTYSGGGSNDSKVKVNLLYNYSLPTGSFKNDFTATAKSSATSPSILPFKASAKWRSNEISLGWKHFFKGSFDAESGWNAYGIAGFGLLFANIENNFSPAIDTSLYLTPTHFGTSKFYRLTLDLGAGVEYPVGAGFFLYSDVRTWLPASDYPSPYLHSNKNVPLPFMISAGMRMLFDY